MCGLSQSSESLRTGSETKGNNSTGWLHCNAVCVSLCVEMVEWWLWLSCDIMSWIWGCGFLGLWLMKLWAGCGVAWRVMIFFESSIQGWFLCVGSVFVLDVFLGAKVSKESFCWRPMRLTTCYVTGRESGQSLTQWVLWVVLYCMLPVRMVFVPAALVFYPFWPRIVCGPWERAQYSTLSNSTVWDWICGTAWSYHSRTDKPSGGQLIHLESNMIKKYQGQESLS